MKRTVILCIAVATGYGIAHDQVTARLCIEYFTVAHPPLFPFSSPTLLAVCWGITATVGFGAILGALLALAANRGPAPPLPSTHFVRPLACLFTVMVFAACAAGVAGWLLAECGAVSIPSTFADSVPAQRHHAFMAVWFAHAASYVVGLGGGVLLIHRVWRERGRPPLFTILPRTPGAAIRAAALVVLAAYILWRHFVAE